MRIASGAIGACVWSGGLRRRYLRKILDAAEAAAGASAHRSATRKMRLQSLAGNRDLELPPVFDLFHLDAADIGDAIGDLLCQSKTISEIFEIVWRRHHDREGRAAYNDLDGRFNRDRSRELRPTGAGIVGKGSDWNVDRTSALTRPHRPRPSRSGATRPPPHDPAIASRRNGWSAAPARPSPYIQGSSSPNPNSRW